MLLRTRIFRQLVAFALVPALVMTLVSYFLLTRAIDQTGRWLAAGSPERTINTLRLGEARMQEQVRFILDRIDLKRINIDACGLDWLLTDKEGFTTAVLLDSGVSDSLGRKIANAVQTAGPLRLVLDRYLVIGAVSEREMTPLAGGYLFDREYLSGYESATASLSESRGFKNILPAYILFFGFSGGVVLVLVVIIAYILSRKFSTSITTPLERLAEFADRIASQKTPQKNVLSGTDEVVKLAETLNRMIDDLDESRRRLIAAERVAAWQDFARRMAHELKNPLTPISVSLYRIKRRLESGGEYEQYAEPIEAISAELEHLERLAGDYSSLAWLPEPKYTTFDLNELAREIIGLFAGQLEAFQFENRVGSSDNSIEADRDRLREVMVNLVKNAIDFTSPGGSIVIECGREKSSTFFAVRNECKDKGLTAENLKSAKLPYYTTREGGSGLGLAISEKIIIDHGGSLTLSVEEGMTDARFEIPVALNRQA